MNFNSLSFAENINFLTADGKRFAHPLHHLGKSQSDLPLIAIDSFRHMYLFKNFKDIFVEGKLKRFVEDLHSGKLHRYAEAPQECQFHKKYQTEINNSYFHLQRIPLWSREIGRRYRKRSGGCESDNTTRIDVQEIGAIQESLHTAARRTLSAACEGENQMKLLLKI